MSSKEFSNVEVKDIISDLEANPGNSITSINHQATNNSDGKYIVIKDIHNNVMMPTTMASNMLKNFQASFNATSIQNLIDKGYSIVGSANLDEFAMGSTTKTSIFGPVENVMDASLTPGGSSGGSAYIVAKGIVPLATGTDTGGSIRQPAAFNGIYGLKPTYGLVSRYGTLSFASSFDTIGPMTKDLEDNAKLINDLASNDEYDQTNFMPDDFDALKTFNQDIKGMKVGVMNRWLDSVRDEEIKEAILNQIEILKSLGAEIVEVDSPMTKYSFSLYMILAYAEASSNLNRYDGIRYGLAFDDTNNSYKKVRDNFGTEVKKRLIIGTYMLSSEHSKQYFYKGQELRKKMSDEFDNIYNKVDVVIAPTTPTLAFKSQEGMEPLDSYLSDQFTIPANLVGFPSLNVPIGTSNDGRFIGMQIMADKYNEHIIYQVANNLKGASHV